MYGKFKLKDINIWFGIILSHYILEKHIEIFHYVKIMLSVLLASKMWLHDIFQKNITGRQNITYSKYNQKRVHEYLSHVKKIILI